MIAMLSRSISHRLACATARATAGPPASQYLHPANSSRTSSLVPALQRYRPMATSCAAASDSPSHITNANAEHIVLGIESSCDDTGVAIVTSGGRILGEAIASQEDVHKHWGGVVPNLAQAAHAANIDAVVEDALQQAGVQARAMPFFCIESCAHGCCVHALASAVGAMSHADAPA